MNWWPGKQDNVLNEKATAAERRLKAIKHAGKNLRKSVDDSLRTKGSTKNKNDDLDLRKRRTAEFNLGDSLALGVQVLNDEPSTTTFESRPHSMGQEELLTTGRELNQPSLFPLNTILERYANFEKTIGLMVADNDMRILTFLSSDTPISKLLNDEIPAVTQAKKDLEQLVKRHQQALSSLERENKKLERMQNSINSKDPDRDDNVLDQDLLNQQIEKRDKLAYDVDMLSKDVSQDQDKITSTLLTLVSRESRYAKSVLELMEIKKEFYKNAFSTIEAELPNIERILNDTHFRPVFGECLEDHLKATGRTIAYPIVLAVSYLRAWGLHEEGLFRISPKQIKLDKFKAYLDSNIPISAELVSDSDAHLFSALLKSYLRELPVPFLGGQDAEIYHKWIQIASLSSTQERVDGICNILKDFPKAISLNIQYLVKFLSELSIEAKETKMTPHNISICLGPTILWNDRSSLNEQSNIERIIGIVATLIESYNQIFSKDLDWKDYEDLDVEQLFQDGKNYHSQQIDGGIISRNKKGNGNTNRESKDLSSNGNSTSSSRISVVLDMPTTPTINIQAPNSDNSLTGPNSKSMADNSPSPNRQRRGTFGASFKKNFVTKIQNIGSPLATKSIDERDGDDAEDKRTIE